VNLLLALILLFTSYKVDRSMLLFFYSPFGVLSYFTMFEMDIYDAIIAHPILPFMRMTSSHCHFTKIYLFYFL
jgi:hypothetical protein